MTINMGDEDLGVVHKITGIGCHVRQEELHNWLTERSINVKEVHVGLKEGDKHTVRAFIVVDTPEDAVKLHQLNNEIFKGKVLHVYKTDRQQIERMKEIISLKDCCLRMGELPSNVTKDDVTDFFRGLAIRPNGIFIPVQPSSPKTEAYVQFVDQRTAESALRRHGFHIRNHRVVLTRSSIHQRRLAEERTMNLLKSEASHIPKGKAGFDESNSSKMLLESGVVAERIMKVVGHGWRVSGKELGAWFEAGNVDVEQVYSLCSPGRPPKKMSYIIVKDPLDVDKGLEKDKRYIGNRYVEVYRVNAMELESLRTKSKFVFMFNLPLRTSEEGIRYFFDGLPIKKVYFVAGKQHTKDAYIEFGDKEAAEEALEKNGEMLGFRMAQLCRTSVKNLAEVTEVMIEEGSSEGPTADEAASEEQEILDFEIASTTLKLTGLKDSTNEEKIWKWFTDDDMRVASVSIPKEGVALVTLENEEDIEPALKKSNTKLGNINVKVTLAMAEKRKSEKPKGSSSRKADDECGYVLIRGFPFSCTEQHFRDFFEGLPITKGGVIFARNRDGRLSGEAVIQFADKESSLKALGYHMKYIGSRYVKVFAANGLFWNDLHQDATRRMVKQEKRSLDTSMESEPPMKRKKLDVPQGTKVFKIFGLPWTVGRQGIIDWLAENNVTVKEVCLGWRGKRSSGIVFVVVDDGEAAEKVNSLNKRVLEDRIVNVRQSSNMEVMSMMQLMDSQDYYVYIQNVPYECSAKDVLEFFSGLDIDAVFALPDRAELAEVAVQFRTEEMAREALKKKGSSLGKRVVKVLSCNLLQLSKLNLSTRAEDLQSKESLFPHLMAMQKEGRNKSTEDEQGQGKKQRKRTTSASTAGSESDTFDPSASFLSSKKRKSGSKKAETSSELEVASGFNLESQKKRKKKTSESDSVLDSNVSKGELPVEEKIEVGEESTPLTKSQKKNLKKKKRKASLALQQSSVEGGDTSFDGNFSRNELEEESSVKDSSSVQLPLSRKKLKKLKKKNKASQESSTVPDDSFRSDLDDTIGSLDFQSPSKAEDSSMISGLSPKKKRKKRLSETLMETVEETYDDQVPKRSGGSKKKRRSSVFMETDKVQETPKTAIEHESLVLTHSKKKKKKKSSYEDN